MDSGHEIELRLLGSLEARARDRLLSLGGPKQQAVLATLLLDADDTASVERLIDAVWGEEPPSAAGHSLEAYVSNLRRTLAPSGVTIERRGGGYRLDLGDAWLDSREFERLLDAAEHAPSDADAGKLAAEALALWRGGVAAGTPLHGFGSAGVARLEELRLRAFELRFDAELDQGRHETLLSELAALVRENPTRERMVGQLMLALYRSGRQADAVELYERTRRTLADELGLQPSKELQRLSGQIARQEEAIDAPTRSRPPRARSAHRRLLAGAAVGLVAASLAATTVAWVLRSPDGATGQRPPKVALVLPRAPEAGREDTYVTPFVDGLLRARREYDLDTRTFVASETDPKWRGFDGLVDRLRTERFDLVLVAGGGATAQRLAATAEQLPGSRFVFIDAFLRHDSAPNVTSFRFDGSQAGELAGYLSALMERGQQASARDHRLSAIAAFPIPQQTALVAGFKRGVHRVLPGASIRVDYSHDFTDRSACGRLAGIQIDGGSHVVFAPAGTCGLGALSAAGLRGAWAFGADLGTAPPGNQVLGSTVTRLDQGLLLAVRAYANGTLSSHKVVVLGLSDDAVGISEISPDVPQAIRREVSRLAIRLAARSSRTH